MTNRRCAGFTLVELVVVIAMIAVIMAAMTTSVQQARQRARVARATQEVREMTNAILAYEQYARGHTLKNVATGKDGDGWKNCTEGAMKMILGGETGDNGETVPVLFNATVKNGQLLDPWGKPYQYMIEETEGLSDTTGSFSTAVALPNFYRLTDSERGRSLATGGN